jgi:DNA-binding NarL/FixJ family response regulator
MAAEQLKKRWMPSADSLLSRGEVGVLRMIADGSTDREIADDLDVSKKAIEQCRHTLYAKTGARNRVQLTRYAVSSGLVPVRCAADIGVKPDIASVAT